MAKKSKQLSPFEARWRIGTDDAENLVRFLNGKIAPQQLA